MRKDILVYISGPITPKNGYAIEDNVAAGLKIFFGLIDLGIPAFCPQMTAAFPSSHEVSWGKWMEYDYAIIARCTHMVMLPRWQNSKGALEERIFAEANGIPVFETVLKLLESINGEEKSARPQVSADKSR